MQSKRIADVERKDVVNPRGYSLRNNVNIRVYRNTVMHQCVYSIVCVLKFTYMWRDLVERADNYIKGLVIDKESYTEAKAVLKSGFGNNEVIIKSHMKSLIYISSAALNFEVKKIRPLNDKIQVNFWNWWDLGI